MGCARCREDECFMVCKNKKRYEYLTTGSRARFERHKSTWVFFNYFFFLQKLRIYGLINVIKLAQHYNYTRKKKVKKLNFYFSQMSQTNSFFYEFHKYSNYTNNN